MYTLKTVLNYILKFYSNVIHFSKIYSCSFFPLKIEVLFIGLWDITSYNLIFFHNVNKLRKT